MKAWLVKDRCGKEHTVPASSRNEAHTQGIAHFGWITSTRPARLHAAQASV